MFAKKTDYKNPMAILKGYYNSFYLTVCLEIQTQIDELSPNETIINDDYSQHLRWSFGICSSVNSDAENPVYQYGSIFVERCCLVPGRHTLTCDSSIPTRGWKNAHLTIAGHIYCDNFIGFKLMQNIIVSGINSD